VLLRAETIETPRLLITPLRVDDAEAMVDVLADVRMYEFTGPVVRISVLKAKPV